MAEQVEIATLKIDFDDVIEKSALFKKRIDEIKASQKAVDKTTLEGQKQFAKLDSELRNLNQSYRDNQRFAAALDKANGNLTKTLDIENKSTQELRESRSALNQISKQLERSEGELTGNLEYEAKLREELNTVIDAQTEKLREQSSSFNASKDGIGEYEEGIKSAFQEINIFNGGLSGFIARSSEAGGTGKLFTNALGGITKGFIGATKASLAFIATPIGALLAVLAGAFALVQNALNRSEEATAKLSRGFAAFRGITNGLLRILEPLGEFLIDGLVKGFELVEKAGFAALRALESGLRAIGFDSAADSVKGFTNSIQEAAEQSKALADAQLDLEKSQRRARLVQLEYQKDAEILRQIRDDENKSIRERIKANDDLGAVLEEQLTVELQIAQKALEVANLRIQAEGQTKEALDAQADALTEIADIQERVTGQESEQLTNRVALQKEAADKAREIQDKALERQKDALDLFVEQQGIRAKTLEEGLADAERISKKQIEILDAELKAKKITIERYNAEILAIENDLLAQRSELAVENFKRELDQFIESNKSRIDEEKSLTDEIVQAELERAEAIAEQRREFEQKRLDEGVINRTAFNDAINEIDEENRVFREDLEKELDEQKKEKAAIDAENRLAAIEASGEAEAELLRARLENERQIEIAEAEKTGASIQLINEKFAEREKALDKALQASKLSSVAETAGQVADLLGEQTALGKAAAIAQATINTFQGATLALATFPGPVGIAAAAATIATGLVNVGKILAVDDTFARGGILKGKSHAQGGIKTRFGELEGGEAVMNKRSTRMFAPLLSELNVAGGGVRFAGGGILGSASQPSGAGGFDSIINGFQRAVSELPAPVVGMEEFISAGNKFAAIKERASL